MIRAMVPTRRDIRAFERQATGLSGWNIAGIVAGALVAILVVMNAKDVVRYIKISSM